MKKGSAWRKNNRREIKKSFERYLAIIVIITLGVGFFAGLRITKDAMTTTLNSYVTTYKLHDFQLISTLGLVDEDVTYFAGLPEVEAAEGAISADVLVKVSAGGNGSDTGLVNASDNGEGTGEGDGASGALASIAENFVSEGGSQNGASNGSSSELVIKAFSLTDKVNQVDLQAGRMPQAADEVVVDAKLFSEKDLGKRLLVAADNDEETLDLLAYDAYTIVGLANSVNYINIDRGTTLIGDGVVNAFAYMPLDGFDADYFTEIYLDVNPAGAIYTDAYREQIDQTEGLVEDALQERADLRYQSIVDEAEEELAKGQADYDEALAEYETEKADALAKLEDARLELEDAKKTLEENEQELRDGEAKLADGEAEYQKGLADYEKGLATFEASKADTLAQLDASERKLADGEAQVAAGLRAIEDSGVLEQYEDLKASLPQLEAGKEQLAAAKAEAEAKFAAAEEALQAGEAELEAQGQTLAASREQLEALKLLPDADLEALAEQEAVLAAAEAQYEEGKAALLAQRETFEQEKEVGTAALAEQEATLEANLSAVTAGIAEIEASGVHAQYDELKATQSQLAASRRELVAGRAEAERKLAAAEADLAAGKAELDAARATLDESATTLAEGRASLADGWREYEEGLATYEENKVEAEEGFAEAEDKLAEAASDLAKGREDIAAIEEPTIYVLDRSYNSGYANFDNDSSIVESIAQVLPVFFFLVAALICSTTMSRMIEEQRTQIGTLKAIGYSDGSVLWKYMGYSGSAALIGSVLGYFLGTKFFPMAIWEAYGMLYDFAPIEFIFDLRLAWTSLLAALVSSVGVTYLSCIRELRQSPAELIRPKAPKPGKRVLLERIPFIWKRFGFLRKVSVRNMFRYKKRLLMTVIGVAGCTALLLTAFGINDSIRNVANDQFDTIMAYDYELYFSSPMSLEEQATFRESYSDVLSRAVFVATDNVDVLLTKEAEASTIKSSFSASLVATDDPQISEVIGLYEEGATLGTAGSGGSGTVGSGTVGSGTVGSGGTSVGSSGSSGSSVGSGGSGTGGSASGSETRQGVLPYPGAGEAVISNKMASELGLEVGDTIRFLKSGSESEEDYISLRVSGIFENYISNYIFITGETYADSYGEEPEYKNAYTVLAEGDEQTAFARLASDDSISRIVMLGEIRNSVDRMMQGLNSIIWLIIALALSLAFVVVYNISNINITERNRELATIKVLGFYDAESYLYIFRENIVLTVVGALVGLLLGKGLHTFVMSKINVEAISFKAQIFSPSYLLAFALTIVITLVVSMLLSRKVRHIDMAESLKSAE